MRPRWLLAFVPTFTLLAACAAEGEAAEPLTSGIERANFDPSVRFQDDLFHAVNGAWLAKTEIPADRADYGAFTVLAEQAEKDVRAIIESCASAGENASGPRKEDRRPVRLVHGRGAGRAAWHQAHRRHARGDRQDRDQGRPRADARRVGAGRDQRRGALLDRSRCQAIRSVHPSSLPGGPRPAGPRLLLGRQVQGEAGGLRGARRAEPGALRRRRCPRAAAEIVAFETRLARAQWSKEDNRDDVKTYNKLTRDGACPAGARLRLEVVPRRRRRRRRGGTHRCAAVVLHGRRRDGGLGAAGNLEGVAEVESGPSAREPAEPGAGRRGLRLLRQHAPRHSRESPALEAGRRRRRGQPRRGGRQDVRRQAFPARRQAADGRDGQEHHRGLWPGHPRPRLDEPEHQAEGARQAGGLQPEDRLSEKVARLLRARDPARRPGRQHAARGGLRVESRDSPGSASRWTATNGS